MNVQTVPFPKNTSLQCVHLSIFFSVSKVIVRITFFVKSNELFYNYMSSKLEISLCHGLAREGAGKNFKLKVELLYVSMKENDQQEGVRAI